MAKYTMKQRIAYHQGKKSAGGVTGSYSRGYIAGAKAQQTANRLSRTRSANKNSESGGKKK